VIDVTLRQHLEAIGDAAQIELLGAGLVPANLGLVRQFHAHALAALAILDAAQTQQGGPWNTCRLVPDPGGA
jgi:hypothetical protein